MDYYKILQRSWEIVKREKILWVFGMVLAAFSGGGGGGGGSSLDDAIKLFKEKDKIPPETGEKVAQVLGVATNDPKGFFLSVLSSIPLSFWIALALGILVLIFFYLILGIFLRNWATGALFSLASAAETEGKLSLEKGSQLGVQSWKRLFLVSLIIKGSFIITSILSLLFSGLLFYLSPGAIKIITGLFSILLVILFILFALVTSLWEVFAELVVVLENYRTKQALSFAWRLTKKFFWEGVIMGIINIGLGCLVGFFTIIIYSLLGGIIAVGFLVNQALGLALLLLLGLPLLILLLGGILISGVLRAFTSCNWVLFYQELRKKESFPRSSAELNL